MDNKLNTRAKLIYERNNTSPLFLRTAAFYLLKNDSDTAISILKSGEEFFPNHPLSSLLLSKAYHLKGDNEKTEAYLKKASKYLDDDLVYQYYKKEFNLPERKKSPFDSSRGNIFVNTIDFKETNEHETDKSERKSVDDNLKQIADQLMNARINRNENITSNENIDQKNNPDKTKLASETLANIYIAQGQTNEAIKIFEHLLRANPGKREYYLEKIKKVKSG